MNQQAASKVSRIVVCCLAALLVTSKPVAARAEGVVAAAINDPQAFIASIASKCSSDIGNCVKDGLKNSFGPSALEEEAVVDFLRNMAGTKSKHWAILSDTSYSDTIRIIYAVVILENNSTLYFRSQFTKAGTTWRIVDIVFEPKAIDIFIPLPPNGTPNPIVNINPQPK
jgi:hypothetical protein